MKFFTKKEVFHQQNFLLDQGSFPQSKKVSANKDQIGSLNAKIFDPFNTKSYTKIFSTP